MAYFSAFLHMLDPEKNKQTLSDHIAYLEKLDHAGKVFARGPFLDGSGGLVVYIADSFDEALSLAETDPHIIGKSRRLELREWNLVQSSMVHGR
jgi:uncharacterized protein